MKNVSQKKGLILGTNTADVELPLVPLIKETYTCNPDKLLVNIKLRRDHTSSTSDIYKFEIYLFDHGEPE